MINRISGMESTVYGGYTTYGRPISNDHVRVYTSVELRRKQGCVWLINGEKCKKECVPFIFYCEEHKNITNVDRVIHDPLTICRKRK